MQADWRQRLGAAGEEIAAQFLEAQRLVVVARNFRCKAGELDLVCTDGDLLVVVEVRRRSRTDFGGALASVGRSKQRRIRLATQLFLLRERQWRDRRVRFDVVALHGAAPAVEWIRDAFRA